MTERQKPGKYYGVKGFGLGAAVLTVTQLKKVYSLIAKMVGNLSDPDHDVLQKELKERLLTAGIEVDQHVPVRGFANRSILDGRHADPATVAHHKELEKVAESISACKAVRLKIWQDQNGEWIEQTVWPLQILFHNIAWYLAYQQTNDIRGVITVTRLDRLKLDGLLPNRRSVKEMLAAQRRLDLLCRRCGGILLSRDGEKQEDVLGLSFRNGAKIGDPLDTLSRKQIKQLIIKGSMTAVRFRCTPSVFGFMREGFNRYPPEQMRLSGPRPGDKWNLPDIGIEQLHPSLDENETHPYPVEFILPCWTVDSHDFRRWLFGFDCRIVIEEPKSLRDQHQQFGAGIVALYPASATDDSPAADHMDHSIP